MPALPRFAEIGFRGGRGVSTAPIRRVRPRRHISVEFPPKAGDGLAPKHALPTLFAGLAARNFC